MVPPVCPPLTVLASVSVFGGAAPGRAAGYRRAAAALGRGLAEGGVRIVYGGGRHGMMGALADAALAAGGEVIGVVPSFLLARGGGHEGLTSLRVVETMHARKATMYELSQASCALPGGIGTLDEAIEMIAWRQLGLHDRPIVMLGVDGYWDRFAALIERVIVEGFAGPSTRDLFRVAADAEEAIALLSETAGV